MRLERDDDGGVRLERKDVGGVCLERDDVGSVRLECDDVGVTRGELGCDFVRAWGARIDHLVDVYALAGYARTPRV